MKILEEYDIACPEWALCYIVNDDCSGLEDSEIKEVDEYMQYYESLAEKMGGHVVFSCGEEEPYFTWNPDFGKACTVIDCKVAILK